MKSTDKKWTYTVDGIDVSLGTDEMLQCSTEAIPRSLMYCGIAMLRLTDMYQQQYHTSMSHSATFMSHVTWY